eukprot:ANDGO_06293.mRNA.4 hypothetical protein
MCLLFSGCPSTRHICVLTVICLFVCLSVCLFVCSLACLLVCVCVCRTPWNGTKYFDGVNKRFRFDWFSGEKASVSIARYDVLDNQGWGKLFAYCKLIDVCQYEPVEPPMSSVGNLTGAEFKGIVEVRGLQTEHWQFPYSSPPEYWAVYDYYVQEVHPDVYFPVQFTYHGYDGAYEVDWLHFEIDTKLPESVFEPEQSYVLCSILH